MLMEPCWEQRPQGAQQGHTARHRAPRAACFQPCISSAQPILLHLCAHPPSSKHPLEHRDSQRHPWEKAADIQTTRKGEVEILHRNLLCVENWVSNEMKASVRSAPSPAALIFHQKIKEKKHCQFLSQFFVCLFMFVCLFFSFSASLGQRL